MTTLARTVVKPPTPMTLRARLRVSLGKLLLRALGWRIEGEMPQVSHAVLIGAPHTSLWDGLYVVLGAMALNLPARTMAKHSLFRGPLGPIVRGLGFFPVNRAAPGGMVAQCAARLRQPEPIFMVIAPEGTRSGANGPWRTGFHRIAARAGVPMLPVAMDYGQKRLLIGAPRMAGEDVQADVRQVQRFFAQATPKHPERMSEPLRQIVDAKTSPSKG